MFYVNVADRSNNNIILISYIFNGNNANSVCTLNLWDIVSEFGITFTTKSNRETKHDFMQILIKTSKR